MLLMDITFSDENQKGCRCFYPLKDVPKSLIKRASSSSGEVEDPEALVKLQNSKNMMTALAEALSKRVDGRVSPKPGVGKMEILAVARVYDVDETKYGKIEHVCQSLYNKTIFVCEFIDDYVGEVKLRLSADIDGFGNVKKAKQRIFKRYIGFLSLEDDEDNSTSWYIPLGAIPEEILRSANGDTDEIIDTLIKGIEDLASCSVSRSVSWYDYEFYADLKVYKLITNFNHWKDEEDICIALNSGRNTLKDFRAKEINLIENISFSSTIPLEYI